MNEDTKPAVTEWIPGHIKPVRVGVYERDTNLGRWSYWSGEFWATADTVSPSSAMDPEWIGLPSGTQDAPWRGLASDPAKPADPKRKPREWMRWSTALGGQLTEVYSSRNYARSCVIDGERVIRVRVTEV
jgi:hypothetical protein